MTHVNQPTARARRNATLKRQATAASLGTLLAVFGLVAAGSAATREATPAPPPVARAVSAQSAATGPVSDAGRAAPVRQAVRPRTRQS